MPESLVSQTHWLAFGMDSTILPFLGGGQISRSSTRTSSKKPQEQTCATGSTCWQAWKVRSSPKVGLCLPRCSNSNYAAESCVWTLWIFLIGWVQNKSGETICSHNARSQRKEYQEAVSSTGRSQNCRRSENWLHELHVSAKALWLTAGIAKENGWVPISSS